MRYLIQSVDERARAMHGQVVVVHAGKQEEPIARCSVCRTRQGGMLVRSPPMEAEQDGTVRVHKLTKVIVRRRRLDLAEERLVPANTARYVTYADDFLSAFHRIPVLEERWPLLRTDPYAPRHFEVPGSYVTMGPSAARSAATTDGSDSMPSLASSAAARGATASMDPLLPAPRPRCAGTRAAWCA